MSSSNNGPGCRETLTVLIGGAMLCAALFFVLAHLFDGQEVPWPPHNKRFSDLENSVKFLEARVRELEEAGR